MNINYNKAIELLKFESKKVIEKLRIDNTPELINTKKDIDNAIKWLKRGMDNQINPDFNIITIPNKETQTPSSEYRLIEDQETDEKQYWTEVKFNKKELRPLPGDFLIMK